MRKKPKKIYHAYRGKPRWKKALLWGGAALGTLILLTVASVWLLFRQELEIGRAHV